MMTKGQKAYNFILRQVSEGALPSSTKSFFVFLGTTANKGKNTITKRIVPTSIKAPKSPKSRMASAFTKIRQAKAATVVMLPMTKGCMTSFKASRLLGSCLMWSR